jgi:hypothetical protein
LDHDSPSPRLQNHSTAPWLASFFAIAVASAVYPPLAVPGVVATLLLGLATPWPEPGRARSMARAAITVAAISAGVGLVRFAASKAMLGIVEGGQSATAFGALWKLREVVLAEDGLRQTAPWDPDGDHVGSAALIGALAGSAPLRGTKRLDAPLLNYAFREQTPTAIGPAARVEGYLLIVCLPKVGGGFTARPEEPVDDEQAERRYVAYAWPSESAKGMTTVFFADEHERLLVLDPPRGAAPPYLGTDRPPACDAALGNDGLAWKPWKGKKPRSTLPGDSP